MYTSELTAQDCLDLKQKLRQASPKTFQLQPASTTGHLDFQTLQEGMSPLFSKFSWFQTIQSRLISAALKSPQNQGVSIWNQLLDELYAAAMDKTSQNSCQQLRFCAHMAIMLMLHNRIDAGKPPSGQSPTAKYNKIVSQYIA